MRRLDRVFAYDDATGEIGTRLLEDVYAAARCHYRSLIQIETVRALPGGVARDEAGYRYPTNRAHQPGVTSIRSRCQIADHSGSDEATLVEATTYADGYSLVQWRDAVPEEIIKDVAALQDLSAKATRLKTLKGAARDGSTAS